MDSLPNELLLRILGYCKSPTLWNLMFISRRYAAIMKQNASKVRISLPVSELSIKFSEKEIRLDRIVSKPRSTEEEADLKWTRVLNCLKSGAQELFEHIWYSNPSRSIYSIKTDQRPDVREKAAESKLSKTLEALLSSLRTTKVIEWSDMIEQELFDSMWYMSPLQTNITIEDDRFWKILDKIPRSWLARTTKIKLMWYGGQGNIIKLISQLANCTSFEIGTTEKADINQVLGGIRSLQQLCLLGFCYSHCNDQTLDLLIEKSNKNPIGLEDFSFLSRRNNFSLGKVIHFMKKFSTIMSKGSKGAIVMSMGSIAHFHAFPAEVKTGIAKVVERMSDYHFLFKITKGDTSTPDYFKHLSNVDFVYWLSQSDLLANPRLRVFKMHGGINGLTESMLRGVPVVIIPVFADQFRNGRNSEKRGVGKVVLKLDVNEKNLYTALNEIVSNPSYKQNALRYQKLMQEKPFSAEDRLVKWTEFAANNGVLDSFHVEGARLNFIFYFNLDVFAFLFAVIFVSLFVFYKTLRIICCRVKSQPKKVKKQ